MKYILIKGTSHAGKSTTMDAVCKGLNPSRVQRLNPGKGTLEDFDTSHEMLNGSFVLEVHGTIILVAAGATTEQGFKITTLIDIVVRLKGKIDFAIVSMRSYELKEGYDTPSQLAQVGKCIHEVCIEKIPGDDFMNSTEWLDRVTGILEALRLHGVAVTNNHEVIAG